MAHAPVGAFGAAAAIALGGANNPQQRIAQQTNKLVDHAAATRIAAEKTATNVLAMSLILASGLGTT